jgi:hypothetical protein
MWWSVNNLWGNVWRDWWHYLIFEIFAHLSSNRIVIALLTLPDLIHEMWPSTWKGGISRQKYFLRLRWISHLQVRLRLRCKFGANSLLRCWNIAVFLPALAKATIAKMAIFIRTTQFSVYASVTRCVFLAHTPLALQPSRDVERG